MRGVTILLSSLILTGCTIKPPTIETREWRQNPCTKGALWLYFHDGEATLRPLMASGIEWPAKVATQCRSVTYRIVGLPSPSPDTLSGRRAQTMLQVLSNFGVPTPRFELGDAKDQANPILEIHAYP